jgi:hypothetical protein
MEMRTKRIVKYEAICNVINKHKGLWFNADAISFFKSKIYELVYCGKKKWKKYEGIYYINVVYPDKKKFPPEKVNEIKIEKHTTSENKIRYVIKGIDGYGSVSHAGFTNNLKNAKELALKFYSFVKRKENKDRSLSALGFEFQDMMICP